MVHGCFVIFYCGTVDRIRLEGLKACMDIVLKKVPQLLKLIIIGREEPGGYWWLEKELNEFGGKLILDFRGRQSYRNVINGINESDICICPYPDRLDIAVTYPVKIFDYMIMEKPIVASSLPGVNRILTHGIDSMLFKPGRYDDMADCIVKLYESEGLRKKMAVNAKKNVVKFSWESIDRNIFEFI